MAAPMPEVLPKSERALLVGHAERVCPACGASLTGRKLAACSARCRAALSRQRQAARVSERDTRIGLVLRTAAESIAEAGALLRSPDSLLDQTERRDGR